MKRIITLAIVLALGTIATASQAQTYKPDWATKLVLAGGGTDVTNTITITAQSGGSSPLTYTFPNSVTGKDGYILQNTSGGTLAWVDPASAITLGGDVTGPAGTNVIATTAGPHIVAALNTSGVTGTLNADVLKYGTTLTVTSNALGIDLTHGNTWTGDQLLPADATQAANLVSAVNASTAASTLKADVLKYDASLKVASNQLGIDLTHANTWTGTQTINGAGKLIYTDGNEAAGKVLTSDVNGVASWGNISASTLNLADGKVFIGDATGHAAEQTLSGDISLANNTGTVHVNSVQTAAGTSIVGAVNTASANTLNSDVLKYDATLKVATNQIGVDLGHANTWTAGQTFNSATLGGTKMSAGTASIGANTNDWNLAAGSSFYYVAATGASRNVTGIANGTDGRMLVLVNNGTNSIVLKNQDNGANSAAGNQFNFPGGASGDVIVAPNGTVTLIYDGTSTTTGWRMLSAQ